MRRTVYADTAESTRIDVHTAGRARPPEIAEEDLARAFPWAAVILSRRDGVAHVRWRRRRTARRVRPPADRGAVRQGGTDRWNS